MHTLEQLDENMDERPAKSGRVRRFVLTAGYFVSAAGLILFFSRHLFIAELMNNFRLQIAATIFAYAVLSLVFKARLFGMLQFLIAGVVLLPILMNWWNTTRPVIRPTAKDESTVISLLTFNVLGNNLDQQPVIDLLNSQQADITVVVEYSNRWLESLADFEENSQDALLAPRWHGFGIGIFSQHELENEKVEMLAPEISDFPFLLAEVVIGDQRMVVAAGHFLAPLSPERMAIRNKQIKMTAELISDYMDQRNLPLVLVGDMNAVAWSPFVTDLMQALDLRDSRAGYFYQGSWPSDNYLMRIPIDHALVSPDIRVHRRQLLDCDSSDHVPVFLEFSLPD